MLSYENQREQISARTLLFYLVGAVIIVVGIVLILTRIL